MPDAYRVDILARAEKELVSLPDSVLKRVVQALTGLSENPRPLGCRKLVGTDCRYRIRVGNYRVLYEVAEAEKAVRVYRIRHRSDVYK